MPADRAAYSRKELANLTGRNEKTLSRDRKRGKITVETKSAGRSARWIVSPEEVERLKKKREG